MRVNTRNMVGYAILPGIWPRMRSLFLTGFSSLTYLIAIILYVGRLLPKHHAIFKGTIRPDNIGLVRLMAEAAKNLEFRWRNTDQIVIFAFLLCGLVMLFLYLVGVVAFILSSPVFAADWYDLFKTTYPEKDIAFMMMDRVFGIPGLFNSEVSTNAALYGPFPSTFHYAMWELFRFFSMGMFFIGLVIFLYHVLTYVFEVTQTGKTLDGLSDTDHHFGWLPLRYLIALGLILPFGNGLNSAQWITLYAAKFGSGLATNAWFAFNEKTGLTPIGEAAIGTDAQKSLVAIPQVPDTIGLIKNLLLIRSCMDTHYIGSIFVGDTDGSEGVYLVEAYIVTPTGAKLLLDKLKINPAAIIEDPNNYNTSPSGIASSDISDDFVKVLDFTGGQDIHIVYGYRDPADSKKYEDYTGGVLPVCGEVIIPVTSYNGESIFAAESYFFATLHLTNGLMRKGVVRPNHLDDVLLAVTREYQRNSSSVRAFLMDDLSPNLDCMFDDDADYYQEWSAEAEVIALGKCTDPISSEYWWALIMDYYSWAFEITAYAAYDYLAGTQESAAYEKGAVKYSIGDTSYTALGFDEPMSMTKEIMERGWGGAGLWYNKITERNGSLYGAINATPIIHKYPMAMEAIKAERNKSDSKVQPKFCEQFDPRRSGIIESNTGNEQAQFVAEEAKSLHSLCLQLHENERLVFNYVSNATNYNNPILQSMGAIFAQLKLFDLIENDGVNPLAQLSAIGRLLIDKSIFNLIVGTGASAAGGLAHIAGGNGVAGANSIGQALGSVADAVFSFAVIGLSIGVLLHYVIPLMPFIYFFFAVGTWVKSIFEALVGVPLWALAHLSSKGVGLPGEMASKGYFLILEIMLRPIVTVFALISSFIIFSAAVSILNSVFSLVTTNVLGATVSAGTMDSVRGIADQFFFTVLYIIIVYMIGTSCFKLINLIPDGLVTRWSGSGVTSFGRADTTEMLVSNLTYQLPAITQQEVKQATTLVKDTLYNPAKSWGMQREKEAAEKAATDLAVKKRKEELAAKQANQGGGGPDT